MKERLWQINISRMPNYYEGEQLGDVVKIDWQVGGWFKFLPERIKIDDMTVFEIRSIRFFDYCNPVVNSILVADPGCSLSEERIDSWCRGNEQMRISYETPLGASEMMDGRQGFPVAVAFEICGQFQKELPFFANIFGKGISSP